MIDTVGNRHVGPRIPLRRHITKICAHSYGRQVETARSIPEFNPSICTKQLISTMVGADRPCRQTECLLVLLLATCCCLLALIASVQSNSTQDQIYPYLTADLPETREQDHTSDLLITGTTLPLPSDLSHDRSVLVTGMLGAPPSQPATPTVRPESTPPSTQQDLCHSWTE